MSEEPSLERLAEVLAGRIEALFRDKPGPPVELRVEVFPQRQAAGMTYIEPAILFTLIASDDREPGVWETTQACNRSLLGWIKQAGCVEPASWPMTQIRLLSRAVASDPSATQAQLLRCSRHLTDLVRTNPAAKLYALTHPDAWRHVFDEQVLS